MTRRVQQLVDMHHHLIFGVDDGAQTFQDTQAMLLKAYENGVSHIITTPHATPGAEPFPTEKYLANLEITRQWIAQQGLPVTLYTGSEIYYTDETPRLVQNGYIPTLNETWNVLVEFDYEVTYDRICEAIQQLGNLGYQVVVAHMERYHVLRDVKRVAALRDAYQVTLQMNANTILTRRGFFRDRWVKHMLDHGYIDMVASDAHNTTSRACNLRSAYDELVVRYGQEYATKRCCLNQRKLFALED